MPGRISFGSGRIDVFDSARGGASRLKQYAKGKKKIKELKDKLIIHLCKVINRIAKNTDKYRPDSSDEDIEYFTHYIKFLTELNKSKKIDFDKLDDLKKGTKIDLDKCEKNIIDAVKIFSNGPQSLKDKAILMAGGKKPEANNEFGWIKLLINDMKKTQVSSALSSAITKKTKLEKKNKTENYEKATKALEKARKELYKFKRTKWQWLRDKVNSFDESISDDDESAPDESTKKDTKKFMRIFQKAQDKYTKVTDKNLDLLIDIRDSVDEEDKRKVISVRDEKVLIQMSKLKVKERKSIKKEKAAVLKELRESFKKKKKGSE
jgi:hypothetical protein